VIDDPSIIVIALISANILCHHEHHQFAGFFHLHHARDIWLIK